MLENNKRRRGSAEMTIFIRAAGAETTSKPISQYKMHHCLQSNCGMLSQGIEYVNHHTIKQRH